MHMYATIQRRPLRITVVSQLLHGWNVSCVINGFPWVHMQSRIQRRSVWTRRLRWILFEQWSMQFGAWWRGLSLCAIVQRTPLSNHECQRSLRAVLQRRTNRRNWSRSGQNVRKVSVVLFGHCYHFPSIKLIETNNFPCSNYSCSTRNATQPNAAISSNSGDSTFDNLLNGGSCKNSINETAVLVCIGVVLALVLVYIIVCSVRRIYKPLRPRIKKTYVVHKNVTPTPLTCRPTTEQCEITIENCCNMNICDTVSIRSNSIKF